MRTPVAIDDDVLAAAQELALIHRKSISEVVSALARQALQSQATTYATRNGVPLLQLKSDIAPVTLELVNKLRDELPE